VEWRAGQVRNGGMDLQRSLSHRGRDPKALWLDPWTSSTAALSRAAGRGPRTTAATCGEEDRGDRVLMRGCTKADPRCFRRPDLPETAQEEHDTAGRRQDCGGERPPSRLAGHRDPADRQHSKDCAHAGASELQGRPRLPRGSSRDGGSSGTARGLLHARGPT